MSDLTRFSKGTFFRIFPQLFFDLGFSVRLSAYIRKKQEPQSLKLNHSFLDAHSSASTKVVGVR